jgi:hypothetical protein
MKKFVFAALAAVVAASSASASPTSSGNPSQAGHWEWRSGPAYGPRAPIPAPRRVRIADAAQVAACDCAMMKQASNTCMSMNGNHSG